MKCDTCKYLTGYILGADECGAGNWLSYCAMEHWVDGDPKERAEENHFWDDCKDYEPKTKGEHYE